MENDELRSKRLGASENLYLIWLFGLMLLGTLVARGFTAEKGQGLLLFFQTVFTAFSMIWVLGCLSVGGARDSGDVGNEKLTSLCHCSALLFIVLIAISLLSLVYWAVTHIVV